MCLCFFLSVFFSGQNKCFLYPEKLRGTSTHSWPWEPHRKPHAHVVIGAVLVVRTTPEFLDMHGLFVHMDCISPDGQGS